MEGRSRRDLLISIAAAGAAAAVPGDAQTNRAPLFFTPVEFKMLDELAEIVIPADSHSPGARAADVAVYLDRSFAEAFDKEPRRQFRDGLKLVDKLSHEMHRGAFLDSTPGQRVAVLARMARGEKDPKKPEEHFFVQLKGLVAFVYYTSSIGIHQEMEYKGNTVQNEFSGFDADLAPLTPPTSSK